MRRRSERGLLLGAAALLGALLSVCAVGCGDGHGEEGCPELCEQQAACAADIDEEACLSACEASTEEAEEKGCSEQYTELLECWGHAENVCDDQALADECTIQDQAYESCAGG